MVYGGITGVRQQTLIPLRMLPLSSARLTRLLGRMGDLSQGISRDLLMPA